MAYCISTNNRMGEILEHFRVKQNGFSEFNLLDLDAQTLGKLKLMRALQLSGSISIANSVYRIESISLWSSRFEIKSEESKLGEIKFNWKGEAIIEFKDYPELVFKHFSLWDSSFKLMDKNGQLVCFFKPKIIWSSMNYEIEIAHHPWVLPFEEKELIFLILTFVYAYQSQMSSNVG